MTFVHRIGRTGRAGHTGTAITLVGYDELGKWRLINDELDLNEPEPPQWFSTSPELAEALGFKEGIAESVGPAVKIIGATSKHKKYSTKVRPSRKRRTRSQHR